MTNSKIYIVVQYDDKHIYKPMEQSNWPRPEREIVSTPGQRSDHYRRWLGTHDHQRHRRPADFHGPKPRETQRVRKANQPDKRQVGFRFLREAEHNGDRTPTGRRTLTAIQNKTVLREGLEGMKFPMMMWLGYVIGSQRAGW